MAKRVIGRHAIGPWQHRRRKVGHGRCMGAHITALVVEKFILDCEQAAIAVDCGTHPMALCARMVRCNQVLAPILDPFHRTRKPERRETNEDIFRVELATNPEAAADVAFVQMHGRWVTAEHAGNAVSIPVRHLGCAMELEDVAPRVVARDRAPSFQWNAGLASHREIELNHSMGLAKSRRDITIRFFHDRRLGRMPASILTRCRARIEHDREFIDLDGDKLGCIFSDISVVCEHRRDRFAHVARLPLRQNGLAIGRQPLNSRQPEIDGRDIAYVVKRPYRHDTGCSLRCLQVDCADASVRMWRAHHAHVQHMREGDIRGKTAAAPHKGTILQTHH